MALSRLGTAAWHLLPPRVRMAWIAHENWSRGEPELRLLPRLCDASRLSIDVGASVGVYAYFMRRYSAGVMAIEPQPARARWLRQVFGRDVSIVEVAASDGVSRAMLRVPRDRRLGGLATLEDRTTAGLIGTTDYDTIEVETRSLDSMGLPATGLIKIDVEGHEAAVLRGASALLRRDRPALLIEIEERHRKGAFAEVVSWLSVLGFDGSYYQRGELHPIAEFDAQQSQSPNDIVEGRKRPGAGYINNFLFVHREDARRASLGGIRAS